MIPVCQTVPAGPGGDRAVPQRCARHVRCSLRHGKMPLVRSVLLRALVTYPEKSDVDFLGWLVERWIQTPGDGQPISEVLEAMTGAPFGRNVGAWRDHVKLLRAKLAK